MNKLELAPEFIQGIDWELLKDQKNDLLQSIEDFKIEAKEAGSAGEPELSDRYVKQVNSLTGILNLIDGLQDYAVDFCELPEKKVLDLS